MPDEPKEIATMERPVSDKDSDKDTLTQEPARVILFNDEVHTFDEVIDQIIKATNCPRPKAEALTWQVHHAGKANVFEGEMTECMKVSGVLEEIALHTVIEV